jgi:hypothetical protein
VSCRDMPRGGTQPRTHEAADDIAEYAKHRPTILLGVKVVQVRGT